MKNLFLTTVLLFFFFGALTAQNSAFIIGVNGGANMSKFNPEGDYAFVGDVESRRKLGFQGGLDLGLKLNSFTILTGLHYKQNNGIAEWVNNDVNRQFDLGNGQFDNGTFKSETILNQFSIPILLRYSTKSDFGFTVAMGPVVNIRTGKSTTTESLDLTRLESPSNNLINNSFGPTPNDIYSKTNVGFLLTAGLMYKVSDSGFVRLNFNYLANGDIVNETNGISDNLGNSINFVGSIRTNAVGVEIGYEHRLDFNLGSKY